ncbi:MAG: tetratricopeptide repeat protein [bacterium]|nr:tetratricopeptide repeat protein [bacterium]
MTRWLTLLLLMPLFAFAQGTLTERAALILAARSMPAMPEWASGVVKYYPGLWAVETSVLRSTPPDKLDFAGSPEKYETIVAWYQMTENLAALETWSATMANPRELAQAELALAVLDFARADSLFRVTLENPDPLFQRLAKIGLSKVLHKRQRYGEAAALLETAWTPEQLGDNVIFQMALTKIELGEIGEAVDLLEEALRWNPFNESAHYFLGNGYARRNYLELEASTPYLRCDGSALCARDFVVDGSGEWMRGEFAAALDHFMEALKLVPDYGRAHNGVAKCLEQMRFGENIYRAQDQAAFDAKQTPVVPQIEKYILNWESLSERHRKQIALSVAPWQSYIPVLVASGSHHYIKPLHEKLCEVPGLETIANQRISYDSRLWDDVRGCGGFTTVTGVEDVERSIYNRYNTVLHELTHQVHGVFPPEDMQHIEDVYHEASAEDASGTEIFVSRYQGSSVWEYFAEGVNSYFSPRRNQYDTREITRERLLSLDPQLVALLEHYMSGPNIAACYPVGLITAADNEAEQGKLDTAMDFARQAEAKDRQSEVVLRAISRIACYRDEDDLALEYARQLVKNFPQKAASYGQLAWARAFADGDFAGLLPVVQTGVDKTGGSEQIQARRELANWQVICGKFAEAVVNYELVLAAQGTDDEAIRGYAEALFWSGRAGEADSVYQQAILRRNGVASLRLEYARLLILTGQIAAAGRQIEEAELLKPADGRVAVHRAWWQRQQGGDPEQAVALAQSALQQYPDDALVQVLAARVKGQSLTPPGKAPRWVYNTTEASFEARDFWDGPTLALLRHK